MHIPFPTSISMFYVFSFCGALLGVQLIEGTDPYFAVMMMMAQIFGVAAFNTLGGMSEVAGAFCLLSLASNITVPEIAHAIIGQPGDFHLPVSLKVGAVCAIFYGSLLVVARVVVLFSRSKPVLTRVHFTLFELRAVSIIAAVFSFLIVLASIAAGELKNGTMLALVVHFYRYLNPLSVVLATHVRLKSTRNKSAMDWSVALILAAATFPGVLGASKEGMLLPAFCWLLVCAAYGYRFKPLQVLLLSGVAIVAWIVVFPYSQNARDMVRNTHSFSEQVSAIVAYFSNPSAYKPDENATSFYGEDEFGDSAAKLGFVQRYSLLRANGMMINSDSFEGFTGINRYLPAFLEVIPHVLWPDRPDPIQTNELGHKAGFVLGEEDTTTGIAIGSPSLFYDLGGWIALPVYTLLIFSGYFYALRSMFSKTAHGVWALMMIGAVANSAGAAEPANLVESVIQFFMAFGTLVAILKILARVSVSMFARSVVSNR